MRIAIKLFGAEREKLGADEAVVEVAEGSVDWGTLRPRVAEAYPAIAERLPWCRLAINYELVGDEAVITAGDELALIGAVSGG